MSELTAAIDANDEVLNIDTIPPSPYVQIDDEIMEIRGVKPEQVYPPTQEIRPPTIRVKRGAGGTTAASHADGATLEPVYGLGGGGGGGLENPITEPLTVAPVATSPSPITVEVAEGTGTAGVTIDTPEDHTGAGLRIRNGTLSSVELYAHGAIVLSPIVGNVADAFYIEAFNPLDAGINLMAVWGTDGGVLVGRTGHLFIRATAAPADAEIANGRLAFWFDSTNGAAKLEFKGKTNDGTVVTGEVPLT